MIGSVNLLAVQELAALREGLRDAAAAELFYRSLLSLIRSGPGPAEFEAYADAVASLPAQGATTTDKWTIATILPFLARPDTFMFLKPLVTQKAAGRLAFDLHYNPHPNRTTYDALLHMSQLHMQKLADLHPRDFIDIQSFIWVTGEGD